MLSCNFGNKDPGAIILPFFPFSKVNIPLNLSRRPMSIHIAIEDMFACGFGFSGWLRWNFRYDCFHRLFWDRVFLIEWIGTWPCILNLDSAMAGILDSLGLFACPTTVLPERGVLG